MEYIRRKLERKISYLEQSGMAADLKVYYQVRVEYLLILCVAYLWNKNWEKLDDDSKGYILQRIYRPSIGDIEDIARKLDVNAEFFNSKKIGDTTRKYPRIRNERIGHGYVFEDGTNDLLLALKEIYDIIAKSNINIIQGNFDLVYVNKEENNFYRGISYKPDGSEYVSWHCSVEAQKLSVRNLYLLSEDNSYFRISPFIDVIGEDEIALFSSIQEPLIGGVKYNKIFSTGVVSRNWDDFINAEITSNGTKRKSPNGTILNVFKHNYNKYIDIGIKKRVLDFLLKTQHSVSATIWGHGGVGKTATIQAVCEELSTMREKKFDYIIFLSAKDITYNYKTGKISEVGDCITTVNEIVRCVNKFVFDEEQIDTANIVNYEGKLLLVIDDYETFASEEKERVIDLIRLLNPIHHRVIVTTRADLKLGDEIQTNELDERATGDFFVKVLESEFSDLPIENYKLSISNSDNLKKLFFITKGRPLFIFQFAYTLIQRGSINEAMNVNISESENAINFLYGRIYDYLGQTAKDIFVVISLLVNSNDLNNLINKIKYILNLENESNRFETAIKELEKLRIIEVKESDFFTVYSKEILQKMHDYFEKRDASFKSSCIRKLNAVSRDKKLDNEEALLQNADTNRLTKNEEEVISSYRHILNRTISPFEIKLQAALNLASYLTIDRGKRETAILLLEEHRHLFSANGKFVKMLATYNWAQGHETTKASAIQMLQNYCAKNNDLKIDTNLELLGLLITYNSIFYISKKDDAKVAFKYNEIDYTQFNALNQKTKEEFNIIWNHHGHLFFKYLKNVNLDDIGSASRQNANTGLYQLAEVLLRVGKHDKAREICEFVLNKFPPNFHPIFDSKLKKMKSMTFK